MKFKHVILTRFNLGLYDRPDADEWMRHRMPFFEQTANSVLCQDEEFEWILSMDKRTPNRYLQEIVRDSRMTIIHEHPNKFRSKGWTITTRMDNDDIYLPGAVRAIQDSFTKQEMVIDIRYYQLFDGVMYSSQRTRPNSPFLSLIENGAKRTCYAKPHTKMLNEYKGVFASDSPLALMVIHDRNLGNKIVGKRVT